MTDNNEHKPGIPGEVKDENSDNEDSEQSVKDAVENGEGPLIDPEVKEELTGDYPEDPVLTEYASHGSSGGDEKVDVTSDWLGDKGDNWKPKTKLSAEQIIAMTQTRLLPKVYSELEELNPLLEQVVEDMEQYAVSYQGLSREQAVDILQAMHSGESPADNERRNMLMEAFAASTMDDE